MAEFQCKLADFEEKVLENGLLIEIIPMEFRSRKVCINALKWSMKTFNTNDAKVRSDMSIRLMGSFPQCILISSFIQGNLKEF